MNKLLILAFLFSAGCLIGWCIEVVFRRFCRENKTRQWINPGFLVGPCLPLYGFALCMLYLLAGLEAFVPIGNAFFRKLVLFVIMAAAMTLLEYIAGLIFIKRMHIQLWDYSNLWMNIDGIICPLYSFFWALLGACYYFLIHPYILGALEWFSRNLAFSFFIGMFYGILLIDVCYSFKLTAKVTQFAKENNILVRYEELKLHIFEMAREQSTRYHFILALGDRFHLPDNLRTYLERQKQSGKLRELNEKVRKFIKK